LISFIFLINNKRRKIWDFTTSAYRATLLIGEKYKKVNLAWFVLRRTYRRKK